MHGHFYIPIYFVLNNSNWNTTSPLDLFFKAPVTKQIPEDKEPLERNLKTEARRADVLILWLDCDREGENIAQEVANVCRAAKTRLQVFRAHFSALIPADIFRALNTVTNVDTRMVDVSGPLFYPATGLPVHIPCLAAPLRLWMLVKK